MIIIGDIHGNYKTLLALLDKIPQESKDKGVVLSGDLVDRGPSSSDVIEFAINNSDYISVVRGNHEQLMLDDGPKEARFYMINGYIGQDSSSVPYASHTSPSLWVMNGGKATIESYIKQIASGSSFDFEMFCKHIKWIEQLPYFLEFKNIKNEKGEHLLVTHSSACKVWKWHQKRREQDRKTFTGSLMWNRHPNIVPIEGIFNIFGHTPIQNGPRIRSCYANIDTGCYETEYPGYGVLTAIEFPSMKVFQQENIDM